MPTSDKKEVSVISSMSIAAIGNDDMTDFGRMAAPMPATTNEIKIATLEHSQTILGSKEKRRHSFRIFSCSRVVLSLLSDKSGRSANSLIRIDSFPRRKSQFFGRIKCHKF